MATLTKRQKQIYDFIKDYIAKHDISPTFEEIKKHLKLKALSTISEHVDELFEKGFISKTGYGARSIEIVDNKKIDLVKIPLLGTIAAGQPIEAILDQNESIAVPRTKIQPNQNYYALRVAGKSMIDENINDGDIVLVQEQTTAENGQKVVALVDNYGATLKKFYKEKGHVRLQPANKNLQPIIIKNTRDFSIQGIAVDIIKNENDLQLEDIISNAKIKRETKLPLNKIILGDAIEGLRKLPDNSCDVVIIDPPYNIGKDFGNNIDKRELGEYVEWSKKWINESIRVMKPTGTMFIYGFSEILAHLSVEIPLNKRWLIWHYTNKNVASLNFWQRSHESIVCAWKERPIFNRDKVREPYTEGFLNGAAGKVRKGTVGRFSKGGQETIYNAHEGGALPRDVIKIAALAGGAGMVERWFLCKTCNDVFSPRELKKHSDHETIKHPTQKPLELTKKLIKSASPNEDSVVLIPFVGSGSECVAAKELGKNYLGFELNPDYVKLAERWLKATKNIPKLF
jgi:site-specific DNA-methyltransferase (adenine-specific)